MANEKNTNNRIVRVFTKTNTDGTKQGLCIWEVAAAMVSSSRDLGRLCSSKYINKWAKFKPLSGFTKKQLTSSDRSSVNYGIDYIPIYNSFGSMIADVSEGKTLRAINYASGKTPWNYTPPSVGPYRLLDFDGYFADADLFLRSVKCNNNYEIIPGEALQLEVDAPANDPGQIAPSDLSVYDGSGNKLNMLYYGIALYGQYLSGGIGKTICPVTTNPGGLSVNGFGYESSVNSDSFTVFGFLSTKAKTDLKTETGGTYYMPILPSKTVHTRRFVSPALNLSFPTNDIGSLDASDMKGRKMYFMLSGRPNISASAKKISDGVYNGSFTYTITNELGTWAQLVFNEITIPAPPMISETQQAYTIVYITIEIESGIPTISLQTYFASDADGANELTQYSRSTYTCTGYSGNITAGYGVYEKPDGKYAKMSELSYDAQLFTAIGSPVAETNSRVFI